MILRMKTKGGREISKLRDCKAKKGGIINQWQGTGRLKQ